MKALALGLHDDADARARLLFVDALGKIDTPEAGMSLAWAAIADEVEEVRSACLDRLQPRKQPEVIAYFVTKLNPKKNGNDVVNLAGVALGRMRARSAIGPLIDALVTVHKITVHKAAGDQSMSTTFGTGPGGSFGIGPGGKSMGSGMVTGGGPTVIYQSISNQAVLDVLVAITGQSFGFDKELWHRWFVSQKKPSEGLDARRN